MTAFIIVSIVIFALGLAGHLHSGEFVGDITTLVMIALGVYLLV